MCSVTQLWRRFPTYSETLWRSCISVLYCLALELLKKHLSRFFVCSVLILIWLLALFTMLVLRSVANFGSTCHSSGSELSVRSHSQHSIWNWRWRQHIPLKHWQHYLHSHGAKTKERIIINNEPSLKPEVTVSFCIGCFEVVTSVSSKEWH
jgi:hypothetical protein